MESSEHLEEMGLDSSSLCEDPHPTKTDSYPHPEESDPPVNGTSVTPTSTTSNDTTLMTTVSTLSDISCIEVSLPSSLNLNSCGVFNNYLFRQDPTTGHLSLVPVQVRAPECLQGLDINLSLVPQSLKGLITPAQITNGTSSDPNAPESPSASYNNCSSVNNPLDRAKAEKGPANPTTETPESVSPEVQPALQEVIDLLKGEFTLDGSLDNGHEDIAMGIFSLYYCTIHSFHYLGQSIFNHLKRK